MSAAEIAAALGNAHRSGAWWRCHCPVHESRGATLALRNGDRGLIVKCWAGCDPRHVLAELRRRGLTRGDFSVTEATRRPAPVDNDLGERIAAARRLWNAARSACGGPVARYLDSRGITIALPASLRWAPRCWHPSGIMLPAMVSRVDSVGGELVGVHRTYLQPESARKADIEPVKAMLGRAACAAVRLAPAAETLLIGEGIETCLAAMQAHSMPAWAALSAGGIEALALPLMVRQCIIIADHDANGRGERAAWAAADRWGREGRRVRIAIPPEPGSDFAHVLLGRSYA